MDLKSYFAENKDLILFDYARDNQKVLDFMNAAPMRLSGIELLYDRSPSFPRLLECQAAKYMTVMGWQKERVSGFFSMSVQQKWVHGQKASCAYIGDFRTDGTRAAAKLWRKAYAEILNLIKADESFDRPQYFLTAILKKNIEALRSLTSSKKDFGFYYEFLKEVDMVNVYGRLPWYRSSKLAAVAAQPEDLPVLKKFLQMNETRKLFGAIFDDSADDCWNYRSSAWQGFALEKFLLIKNQAGQIVACTLPWSPGFAKRMTVVKAPVVLRALFKTLRFCGLNMPGVGDNLETIYLTHLNIHESVDASEAVKAFAEYTFKSEKAAHMISFSDEWGLQNKIKGWVEQRVPVLLFAVSTDKKRVSDGSSVSFEMGLV
ncbi:hypothetical protein [Bdellovibrio sp. NC01]|uniref:hypothetical protein n=1 Tax=Bdellovibrio sp. NC01 TaxID=2220073 RepID=UPI00115B4730|nr:hypothetical protein [Bdellovibrio sp. NC01]QDK38633.1 hypothetical protein DOE51_14105 [Bdellovibrio sp. NC01]